jgi:hypothetical protein
MAPGKRKSAPKRRNLAARALRDPLFRPKIMANPKAYKRRQRFNRKPDDLADDADINQN